MATLARTRAVAQLHELRVLVAMPGSGLRARRFAAALATFPLRTFDLISLSEWPDTETLFSALVSHTSLVACSISAQLAPGVPESLVAASRRARSLRDVVLRVAPYHTYRLLLELVVLGSIVRIERSTVAPMF